MVQNPIQLSSHDPEWAILYDDESRRLQRSLSNSVVQVNHVGSTSIPSIKAKPIVDILVESETYPPNSSIIDSLRTIGHENQGESGVPGRFWFTKRVPRKFNV